MFGLSGWINIFVSIVFVCAVIGLVGLLLWLVMPKVYCYYKNPRTDASFDPQRSPLSQARPPLSPQETSIALHVDSSARSFSLHFGEGRELVGMPIRICFRGVIYSSAPGEGENLLEKTSAREDSFEGRLGAGKKVVWGWKIPEVDIRFTTSFMVYPNENFIVFASEFADQPIEGLSTHEFAEPSFVFPCFENHTPNTRIITYDNLPFAPPQRDFQFALAPVVFFDDYANTFILSSLDHHLTNGIAKYPSPSPHNRVQIACGINGEVNQIPAHHSHHYLLAINHGINRTFQAWGDLLRQYHDAKPKDRYSDIITSSLGYWTDNGAYYYYLPLKGQKMDQTLIQVNGQADKLGIPFQYYQLDSWWYQKSVKKWVRSTLGWLGRLMGGSLYGGTHLWEPDPYFLDLSLEELHQQLGEKPFAAHNRWYSARSPYVEKFKFISNGAQAMPDDPQFWEYLMGYCKDHHILVYEQDWMSTHYEKFPQFRSELGFGERWLRNIAQAAEKRGIGLQFCMATPAMMMYSLQFANLNSIRASDDYSPRWLHVFDIPFFTQTSMLVSALGAWPFKDTYHGTRTGRINGERQPELEALVSNLSGGPVGPGSPLDGFNLPILNAMCRGDGLLYKPDRPLTPIDLMFLPNQRYYLCSTLSDHQGLTWHYYLVANLWPKRAKNRAITPEILNLQGSYVMYNWFAQTAEIFGPESKFGFDLKFEEYVFLVFSPLAERKFALLGDPTKFVMLNDKEFPDVAYLATSIRFTVANVSGGQSPVLIYTEKAPLRLAVDGEPYNFEAKSGLRELALVDYSAENHTLQFTVEFSTKLEKTIVVEFDGT